MDLLNEENVSSLAEPVNAACLEEEWFNQSDPYDLAEIDCVDSGNPHPFFPINSHHLQILGSITSITHYVSLWCAHQVALG
jgi:hypothetical protein